MPFKAPCVKRQHERIESREGCRGAPEYARKIKLHLDEQIRIAQNVGKQGRYTQREYSYILGLLEKQREMVPPPAAEGLHAGMIDLLEKTRDDIRGLDPAGYQDPEDVRRVLENAAQRYEVSVEGPLQRFYQTCFE